jgi:hypothetical protein
LFETDGFPSAVGDSETETRHAGGGRAGERSTGKRGDLSVELFELAAAETSEFINPTLHFIDRFRHSIDGAELSVNAESSGHVYSVR